MDAVKNTPNVLPFNNARMDAPMAPRTAVDKKDDNAQIDHVQIDNAPWRSAFAGAATTAVSSAMAFHMPVIKAFGALTPVGRVISAVSMGATLGGMAHRLFSKEKAFADQGITWGAAMGVGAAFAGLAAATPAFVGMSVAAQLISWTALSVIGGSLSALADVNPKLAIATATGGVWALTAAPNFLAPLTPALGCAAAVVGGGIGAVHNRLFYQNAPTTSVHTTVEANDAPKLNAQTLADAKLANDLSTQAAA